MNPLIKVQVPTVERKEKPRAMNLNIDATGQFFVSTVAIGAMNISSYVSH